MFSTDLMRIAFFNFVNTVYVFCSFDKNTSVVQRIDIIFSVKFKLHLANNAINITSICFIIAVFCDELFSASAVMTNVADEPYLLVNNTIQKYSY